MGERLSGREKERELGMRCQAEKLESVDLCGDGIGERHNATALP